MYRNEIKSIQKNNVQRWMKRSGKGETIIDDKPQVENYQLLPPMGVFRTDSHWLIIAIWEFATELNCGCNAIQKVTEDLRYEV